jgi:Domain of unknown function (DUF4304)
MVEINVMQSQSAAREIAELLQPVLEQERFLRKGLRWYRYESESILVVEVQPAEVLPGPYINLGVYYLKFGSAQFPEVVDCHVDTGLVSVVPNPVRGNELLDPNRTISSDVRRQELAELLHAHAIPWLKTMSNLSAARLVIKQNPLAAHVAPVARADLVSPTDKPHDLDGRGLA